MSTEPSTTPCEIVSIFEGPGFTQLTPVGLVLLVGSIALAIFYFFTTSPGPRAGEALSILGSRPGFGGALPPGLTPLAQRRAGA